MNQIRVIVNGSKGRMGRESVMAVDDDPELDLVAQTDLNDNLNEIIKNTKAQVVLDFTNAEVVMEITEKIIKSGARPVIGTSGLLPQQIEDLQKLCRKKSIGGLIAPNFAIGAVLMMKFSKESAKYFPNAEIIELHHNGKKDAPSGTAIKTANLISEIRKPLTESPSEFELIPGSRGGKSEGVRIHSVRLPGLVAHQEVIFGGNSQTLTIRHDSVHRESFMPGVCLACKKVLGLKKLIYGLENLI